MDQCLRVQSFGALDEISDYTPKKPSHAWPLWWCFFQGPSGSMALKSSSPIWSQASGASKEQKNYMSKKRVKEFEEFDET